MLAGLRIRFLSKKIPGSVNLVRPSKSYPDPNLTKPLLIVIYSSIYWVISTLFKFWPMHIERKDLREISNRKHLVRIRIRSVYNTDPDPYPQSCMLDNAIITQSTYISHIRLRNRCSRRRNLCYLICLRHLIRSRIGSHRIFFSEITVRNWVTI